MTLAVWVLPDAGSFNTNAHPKNRSESCTNAQTKPFSLALATPGYGQPGFFQVTVSSCLYSPMI